MVAGRIQDISVLAEVLFEKRNVSVRGAVDEIARVQQILNVAPPRVRNRGDEGVFRIVSDETLCNMAADFLGVGLGDGL